MHQTDIFSLATTPCHLLSASGCSSIHVHSTADPTYPLTQTLTQAHKLGVHHLVTSSNGRVAASVGFAGDVKLWSCQDGRWSERRQIVGAAIYSEFSFTMVQFLRRSGLIQAIDGSGAGEIWAIALSADGQYLAATTFNGCINIWDELADGRKIRQYETRGCFGMSIDMVRITLWMQI